MSAISLKSITGITSITTPAGVDNQLTLHTNDTTQRVKVTQSGIEIVGVSTFQDIDVDGHTNLDHVNVSGTSTITGVLYPNNGIRVPDNIYSYFGSGNDLSLRHDALGGHHSYIFHHGAGVFKLASDTQMILGETTNRNYIQMNPNSDVKLFFNNAEKLATSNTGVTVTGSITATGTIETTGSELKITGTEPRLTFTDTNNNPDFQIWANAQKFAIYDSTNSATRLHINSSGNVGIGTDNPQCLLDMSKDISGGVNYVDIRNHHATGGAALRVKTQGTYASPTYQGILGASDAGGTIRVGAVSNHPLLLLVNNQEKIRIHTDGQIQAGTSGPVYLNYTGSATPTNNNNSTLLGSNNIGLIGQYSTLNQPFDHSTATTSGNWWMLGRSAGATNEWGLNTRSGGISNLLNVWKVVGDSNGHVSYQAFHTHNGQERLRINSSGKVGINQINPYHILDIVSLGNDANNKQYAGFEKRTETTSGKQAFGLQIASLAETTSGKTPTTFIRLDTRDPSLNGSHGSNAIIASSPSGVTQGMYGRANLDFYVRNGGTYTFLDDPSTSGGAGEMNPILRITSDGNIGFNRPSGLSAGGNQTQSQTATPSRIVFNNHYSNGYTDASLKVYLFNDGATRHGFTSGPSHDLQYHASGASYSKHTFYTQNNKDMHIEAGQVYKPRQFEFLVESNGATISANSWNKLTGLSPDSAHSTGISDGTYWSNTNQRFTVPVTGTYMFFFGGWSGINTSTNNNRYATCFRINSGSFKYIFGGSYCAVDSPMDGTSIVYKLSANDYIELWYYSNLSGTWGGGHRIFWGGYLLG